MSVRIDAYRAVRGSCSSRRNSSKILLIPRQQHRQIRRREGSRIHQECRQGLERRRGRDIIDQDGARGSTVVGSRHGAEPFGSCGVPELELDPFSARGGADFDDLAGEFDADGLGGVGAPFGFEEAVEEAGSVGEENRFSLERDWFDWWIERRGFGLGVYGRW